MYLRSAGVLHTARCAQDEITIAARSSSLPPWLVCTCEEQATGCSRVRRVAMHTWRGVAKGLCGGHSCAEYAAALVGGGHLEQEVVCANAEMLELIMDRRGGVAYQLSKRAVGRAVAMS